MKLIFHSLALVAVGAIATSALAHDPYEITSVAYVRSNQIELFIEMEFPTGMKLAGVNPVRDVTVVSQFESAQPRLRELAGGFFRLTAGNNAVAVLSTNVELGVEDHIRFRLEYAATPYRPLQFTARGLGADSSDNPYGTSLTVLDMLNQKVLGQTTLFAATPSADFPPQPAKTTVAVTPMSAAAITSTTAALVSIQQTNPVPTSTLPAKHKSRMKLLVLFATIAGALFVAFAVLRRRSN